MRRVPCASVYGYADSGQTRLYLQTLDLHDLDHLHLVAEEIQPHV